MNVILVSQCQKGAIPETRRILDQFAERRGSQVWQTSITQAGLETLHRLLRRTARKNTAVACHWIHGRNRSELLWIVGDRSQFNNRGAVPTNTTATDILRKKNENNWHNLRLIRLLAGLAALWHDLGKASKAFQNSLKSSGAKLKNLYRHEWVSVRLFQAFVDGAAEDADWLKRLAAPVEQAGKSWLAGLYKDGLNNAKPPAFAALPPAARAVTWLILSHHRLPYPPDKNYLSQESQLKNFWADLNASWNQHSYDLSSQNEEGVPAGKAAGPEAYWIFPQGLPTTLPAWGKRAAALAEELRQLLATQTSSPPLDDPFVMHLARLSLMLGDHYYSSLDDPRQRLAGHPACPLYANTDKNGARKQKLDEHLLGVEKQGDRAGRSLPHLAAALPALPRVKKLQARSGKTRFQWQNQAVELAGSLRQASAINGAFIVNLASTGCGKTLANLKFMNALAGPAPGLRCAFALGLRVLTRQTGAEYRNRLDSGPENVAILAGGTATQKLYEDRQEPDSGSLSADEHTLLAEDAIVDKYEGEGAGFQLLQQLLPGNQWDKARNLLEAPLLCCTIDHLVPATEALRGGRQILPLLRLLSGDLVLDELDDYDLDDLSAVTRLIFLSGLLGARVLISSATIPPALAQGMFMAYRQGRLYFQRNRGERPLENPPVCCAWLDEFRSASGDCSTPEEFTARHDDFAAKRRERLTREPVRRRAEIRVFPTKANEQNWPSLWAQEVLSSARILHDRQGETISPGGPKISFGLVRLANIDPLFQVAQALFRQNAPAGFQIHLCVYHARFPLLLRAEIEKRLDRTLKRTDGRQPWSQPEIQALLSREGAAANHIFIVLASPIAELGRDHDYDWAIIEPSSLRSIIQLAGRIWRHRPDKICGEPNIIIFNQNYRSLARPQEPQAFYRPGFEGEGFQLKSHRLEDALRPEEYQAIDSRPRLRPQARPEFEADRYLADLEHARLKAGLIPPADSLLEIRPRRGLTSSASFVRAYSGWRCPQALLTGLLPKTQPFRKETRPQIDLCLLPDEEGETYHLIKLFEADRGQKDVPSDKLLDDKLKLECGDGLRPWGETDYLKALQAQAEALEMEDLQRCARLYGTVTLPKSDQGWYFHPVLGFNNKK
jgi:CRISPR-associated endonuclease/helicase Cas3